MCITSRIWPVRTHSSLGYLLCMSERINQWASLKAGGIEGPGECGPSPLALLGIAPCVACVRLRLVIHHCADCLTTTSPRMQVSHKTNARAWEMWASYISPTTSYVPQIHALAAQEHVCGFMYIYLLPHPLSVSIDFDSSFVHHSERAPSNTRTC